MKKEEIEKALNEAYNKAGNNAYFGNGFIMGIDFYKEYADQQTKELQQRVDEKDKDYSECQLLLKEQLDKNKQLQAKVDEQKTKYGELVTLYEENLGQLLDAVNQNKQLQAKVDELEKADELLITAIKQMIMEKHYYLINGTVKVSDSKIPENDTSYKYNEFHHKVWLGTLQPCEIDESELDKVKNKVYTFDNCKAENPIDITDIVEEIYCKCGCGQSFTKFKQPTEKQVESDSIEDIIPKTFYAHLPQMDRLKMLVEHWNRAVSIINDIEQVESECEAVGFAEWIVNQKWDKVMRQGYDDNGELICKTTNQLYEIFKNR